MSWRDAILSEFSPLRPLILVADPDGLLLEEKILTAIQARGFDLLAFDDPIAFRYRYESQYRPYLAPTGSKRLVVRTEEPDTSKLPYDLLQRGHTLSISLNQLFPTLSPAVLRVLASADWDTLYQAQATYQPEALHASLSPQRGIINEAASKDFILRHLFQVAPELIKQPTDLLRLLLHRHTRNQQLPEPLDEYLITQLRSQKEFSEWPLEQILPNREAFFRFLQERWPPPLSPETTIKAGGKRPQKMLRETRPLTYPGPSSLPFDDTEVRHFLADLFLEGILPPISVPNSEHLPPQWQFAIQRDATKERQQRLSGLLTALSKELPSNEAHYSEWLTFAYRWATLNHLWHQEPSAICELSEPYISLQSTLDRTFLAWCQRHYATLYNQPAISSPVMGHHIPKFLARQTLTTSSRELVKRERGTKIALIVVDGLALEQWLIWRKILTSQEEALRLREGATFAWLPTLTSISRQALFSGKIPLYFAKTILATYKEEQLWQQFWQEQKVRRGQVLYKKGLGEKSDLATVQRLLAKRNLRVVGLVVNKVDKIMHGMELGSAGMHNQVRQWAREGFLTQLIHLLLERGFQLFLTSDHGNIEAIGIGKPKEGAAAEVRGERVRIYTNALLRAQVKKAFPTAIEWPPIGVPNNFLPLLTANRTAFIRSGTRTVAHGGISLEEVIVPFIKIEREQT
jgi:hypothetical protein